MTTTTTSGAAIQRYKIGYHSYEWGRRSSTPSGIPDASGPWVRYADHVAALAAGRAAAAQGVADAALPDEVVRLAQVAIRECQYKGNDMPQDWMESAMRACRLIAASPGQAPAPADNVQEDAALWHWLAEYLVGTRTDLDDEIVACETVKDLRKLVKAAIKQGGA